MHFAIAVTIAVLTAQSALSAPVIPPLSNDGSPTPTTPILFGLGAFPSHRPTLFALDHLDARKLIEREDFVGFARELEGLLTRDELDESEALKIPGFLKTVVKGIPHLLGIFGGGGSSQSQPSQTAAPAQRRDLQKLEARLSDSQHDQIERILKFRVPKIGPIPTPRPFIAKDVIQRRSPIDDESGALATKNIIKTLLHIAPIVTTLIPDGGSSHESAPQPSKSPAPAQRRDLQGSEALYIPPIVQFGPKRLSPTQIPKQHKTHPDLKYAIARELSGSLSRQTKGVPVNQNDPFNFGHGPIRLPQSSPIAQRELVELIARQMDEDEDDSGAFSVTKIVQTAKKIFNGKTLKHLAGGASVVSSAVDAGSHLASSHDDAPPPAPSQSGAPAPQTRDFMEASLEARELNELD